MDTKIQLWTGGQGKRRCIKEFYPPPNDGGRATTDKRCIGAASPKAGSDFIMTLNIKLVDMIIMTYERQW